MAVEGHASQRPKVDPSVKIPDAVKRAALRSEELVAARAPKPPNGTAPPAPPANVVVTKFDPNNPNPPDSDSISPPPPTVPQVPVTPPAPEPEVDYKHQFESTQGRLTRAEEEKRQLVQRLNDMQRTLAAMSVPPAPAPQNNQGGTPELRFGTPTGPRKITEKELAEFGPELIDIIGRRAAEVYEPVVAQLQAELQQVKAQVGGVRNVVAQDAQSKLYEVLGKEVPNWEQVNNDPNFIQWLEYPDDLSGVPRKNLLATAFQHGQAGRVVAAFRGFLAYQAAFGPTGGTGQSPGNGAVTLESNSQGGNASTPQIDLVALAAPGRAKSGQTQVPPEKPDVTRAEISQFYRELALGKYKGREQEVAIIEQQIQSAVKEGRIR